MYGDRHIIANTILLKYGYKLKDRIPLKIQLLIWLMSKRHCTKENRINSVRHAEKIQDEDYQKEVH